MQSTTKAGYKNKISSYFIQSFEKDDDESKYDASSIDVDLEEFEIRKYVVALQAAWRSRTARIMVGALKQEANCVDHRNAHPEVHKTQGNLITDCNACAQGDTRQKKVTIYDTGENWNQRFQKIIVLPEETQLERSSKYIALDTLNKDFVSTATTYAKTIISEYFLHVKDKGIVCKNMGGIAGGQKYLWRGILFKMADGSNGPFNGSDEAASKSAGHDLKGSVHYSTCKVRELHVPLIALIDYKGFRMSAQAFLPLGKNSMVYGSADAGATVLNSHDKFNAAMEKAAVELNIRKHIVGRRGQQKELHAAIDVEGHVGLDNRLYLLDLSRTFPPESPAHTKHLNDVFPDGSRVVIEVPVGVELKTPTKADLNPNLSPKTIPAPASAASRDTSYTMVSATVHNAYAHGEFYDLMFEDGSIVHKFPANRMSNKGLSIYWRFLRPEYVKYRGQSLVPLTEQDVVTITDTDTTQKASEHTKSQSKSKSGSAAWEEQEGGGEGEGDSGGGSMDYDSFSTDVGSLDYDDFSSSAGRGGDSLAYDDFSSSSVAGSLDYDDFSSGEEEESFDVDGRGVETDRGVSHSPGAGAGSGGSGGGSGGEDSGHKNNLSAAYDMFDSGYGAFSDIIYEDVMKSSSNSDSDCGSETTAETHMHPHAPQGRRSDVMYSAFDSHGDTTINNLSTPDKSVESGLPKPLSSDALSSFSNLDPEALERNGEIARATERLVTEVIPALAARLAAMSPYAISNLDLSVYFHSHGVNMRHLGLVRDHISPSHSANPVRTLLLLQIVTRTLKNIAREYQRRWMKSEQSTSEMGMKLLLTQFMNLIVGSSQNSELFWTGRVVVGIIQRFGACSIDNIEHLHRVRKLPDFLKAMLKLFLSMIGLTVHDRAMNQFMKDRDPFQFEFIVQDIHSLEPTVKSMHVVDYGTGVMLHELAEEGHSTGNNSLRLLHRIQELSDESFLKALKVMPSHLKTVKKVEEMNMIKSKDKLYRKDVS